MSNSSEPTRYGRDTFDAFEVLPWVWRESDDTVELHYRLGPHHFVETIQSGAPGQPPSALLDLLAVIAGVSYFKAAAPRRLVSAVPLTPAGIAAAQAAYDEGLREFAYRNDLDVPLMTDLEIPVADRRHAPAPTDHRLLVTLGGGRDSALVAAVLRHADIALMTVGANAYADKVGAVTGRGVHHARRVIASNLIALNDGPALNGHVPVTAINSLIAACTAVQLGATDVVMSNEASANHPSHVTDDGHQINHQHSKSWAFEQLLAAALSEVCGLRYYSAVRPWGELAIARAFATATDMHPVIMSCNRAFVRDPAKRSDGWCGQCDKCRFVYLSLAPFMEPNALEAMFGQDLLASTEPDDLDGFAALFAETDRPWDCVGEPEEARAALGLLARSADWHDRPVVRGLVDRFGLPPVDDVDELLAAHGAHGIPADIWPTVAAAFG